MAAHRYWRLMLRVTGGGANGGLGELHMRTSLGGSNVATGGTPSASSQFSAAYSAAKAFDGLTTDTGAGNGWAALAFAGSDGLSSRPWIKYDFGAGNEKDIAEIVIFAPGASGLAVNELPTAWSLQWSDDNVTWVTQRSYAFNSETAAWTFSTSRVYDVRALGAIDIRNRAAFNLARRSAPAPGQPGAPVYDPASLAGKITQNQLAYAHDPVHGGMYKLAGSTTSLGNPTARRVRLYYQFDGRLYAEQQTKADGLFEFKNLAIGPWTVVGIDDTGAQNGVIYSHVNAVPM